MKLLKSHLAMEIIFWFCLGLRQVVAGGIWARWPAASWKRGYLPVAGNCRSPVASDDCRSPIAIEGHWSPELAAGYRCWS
ncbi:hypothetical protein L484_023889 [Morus notabilis]|uniref:Secreted protein n=1 Tax=Morus notabilis TaxID=981085 RepID=W9R5F7_9ROSA|nr:hypothetical protein L484_023889 [Morus notabilis]